MKARINSDVRGKQYFRLLLLSVATLLAGPAMAATTASATLILEGQNKGDTSNWYAGNLQNWQELDYVPCRVHFGSAQGSQTVTIDFPQITGVPVPLHILDFCQ